MEIKEFCIRDTYTLIEAIEVIERNSHRGVIVLSDIDKVVGFLSQGDILNFLLSGGNIHASVTSAMSTSFIFMKDNDMKKAFGIFKVKNISILPIINNDYNLEGVITAKDIFEAVELKKGDE